jgi:hypothetical protein
MKTLDVKKVEAATKAAMICYTKAFISQAKLRIMMITTCLVIALTVQGQNFKSVDKFGMTKQQIADTCARVAWCRASNDFSGEPADVYTGLDFPVVMFIYKADKCYKIMVKNSTPITFEKSYKVIAGKENGMFVYTVEK